MLPGGRGQLRPTGPAMSATQLHSSLAVGETGPPTRTTGAAPCGQRTVAGPSTAGHALFKQNTMDGGLGALFKQNTMDGGLGEPRPAVERTVAGPSTAGRALSKHHGWRIGPSTAGHALFKHHGWRIGPSTAGHALFKHHGWRIGPSTAGHALFKHHGWRIGPSTAGHAVFDHHGWPGEARDECRSSCHRCRLTGDFSMQEAGWAER